MPKECGYCVDCDVLNNHGVIHEYTQNSCRLNAGHEGKCSLYRVEAVTTTDRAIAWLDAVAETLKEKGRKYGNSIDEPVRIFSKASKEDGIAVRIDDKLARIRASEPDDTEDAEADLVGYIALRRGLRSES